MENNALLDAALELATIDSVPVFPCRADKSPCTRNGFKDASCNVEQIRAWWKLHPEALIGVPTGTASTIAVLDLDLLAHKETGHIMTDGAAALRVLMEAHGVEDIPKTWTVQTPSGGTHHYFLHEEGFRCSAGQIAPGVDTRAEGGYVIVPPSAGYKLLVRKTPVSAPPWLAELFRNPKSVSGQPKPGVVALPPTSENASRSLRLDRAAYVTSAMAREAEHVAATPEGARNSTLNIAAFKMGQYVGSRHLDELEVRDKLTEAALRCGLTEMEAQKTITSGMAAGIAQPKEPPPEHIRQNSPTPTPPAANKSDKDNYVQTSSTDAGGVTLKDAGVPKYVSSRAAVPKTFSGQFMPAVRLYDPWTNYIAPEFPLQVFPNLVRDFVINYSLDIGASQAAVAMSCMAALSGAISHDTRLKLSSSFDVGPRLWVLIVGRSSAKKTPAQTEALRPLRELQAEMREIHRKRIAELKKNDASKEEIEAAEHDAPPQLIINDITVEKLQDQLSKQDRGILMHYDELANLLGSMDRYSKGSTGGGGDKAFWLEAYNGGSYDALRLTSEDREIRRLSVSILGGIQPKRMNKLMNLADDGFLQRFLPVIIGNKPAREARDVAGVVAGWTTQMRGVFKTTENGGWVALSPEAEEVFRVFEREIEYLTSSEVVDSILEEFLGKLPGVWGSMCLILHLLHGGGVTPDVGFAVDDNAIVTAVTARSATALMREFVMPHGQLFYHNVGDETRQHLQAIGAHIAGLLGQGKATISARDLQRGPSCFKGMQAKDVSAKITQFIIGGWLEPTEEGDWCRSWHINPAVAAFSERAARHRELAAEMLRRLTPPSYGSDGSATTRQSGGAHA